MTRTAPDTAATAPDAAAPPRAPEGDLLALLGGARATIVRILKREGPRSASLLARDLGITGVAVRRHLAVLEAEGLIEVADRVSSNPEGPGRPAARYRLTASAQRLFPQRYAEVAGDLIEFISDAQGREGVRAFLRWRQDRETARYADAIDAEDVAGRLEQLADLLNAAGFEAAVTEDGERLTLTQTHCAVFDLASQHPEMCAHEAGMFKRLLGREAHVSRRDTLANGASACVCTVTTTSPSTSTPSTS